jgi:hypothetical protein
MNYRLEKTDDGARWVKRIYNSETEKIDEEPLPVNEPINLDPNDFILGSSVLVLKERARIKATKSFDEFMKELEKLPRQEFKPFAFYNKVGDFLDIYWDDDPHYVEWLNSNVEIKRSFEDESKIVGAYVWGIKKILLEAYKDADKPEEFFGFKARDPNYKEEE